MASLSSGQLAEAAVAEKLAKAGYEVVAKNWKTPRCEIDIVAKKERVVYLVEVKYRVQPTQGSGWEYIGKKKLDQMQFAAKIWAQHEQWSGDIRLLAAEVSGPKFETIDIIELA